jgi:hypothetical protein
MGEECKKKRNVTFLLLNKFSPIIIFASFGLGNFRTINKLQYIIIDNRLRSVFPVGKSIACVTAIQTNSLNGKVHTVCVEETCNQPELEA